MNIIEEYIETSHCHFKIVNWLRIRKFDGAKAALHGYLVMIILSSKHY
jgi:hypothetical protein